MPDNSEPDNGHDPGTIETGRLLDVTANDPGAIELDEVVKAFGPSPTDPMAGRDLHLDHLLDHDNDRR